MQHRHYESLTNSYSASFLRNVYANVPPDEVWSVQEKIHGSNLQIACDGEQVKFGSRNQMLETAQDMDSFNHLNHISYDLEKKVLNLYHHLHLVNFTFGTFVVYGELFGGIYGHPNVENDNRFSKVQKGVHYIPHLEFCAFDIVLDSYRYLDLDSCRTLFDSVRLYRAHTLFEGTLEQVLEYPNDGQSTIHKHFNLPPIEDNVMEGVVLRSEYTQFLPNGKRCIIKNKNEKFAEKNRKKKDNIILKATPVMEAAIATIECYINQNRLDAVLSKSVDDLSEGGKVLGRVIGDLVRDAYQDVMEDEPEVINLMDKAEAKRVSKHVAGLARDLVIAEFRRCG